MRVSIDATPLLLRSAGVKTYVFYWTRFLQRLAGNHTLDLFPFLGAPEECVHDRSVLGRWSTLARLVLLHLGNGSSGPILNLIGARLDIFHASHQLFPPPGNTKITAT